MDNETPATASLIELESVANEPSTQLVPIGWEAPAELKDKVKRVLGIDLPVGVTFNKVIKAHFLAQNPALKPKDIKKLYEEFVRSDENQDEVNKFEGRMERNGYTKEVYRIDKSERVFIMHTPPKDQQLAIDRQVDAFIAKNPNATGIQVRNFERALREELKNLRKTVTSLRN